MEEKHTTCELATELAKRIPVKLFTFLIRPLQVYILKIFNIYGCIVQTTVDHYGNTVLVIEHNMDVIKAADHIIDIG